GEPPGAGVERRRRRVLPAPRLRGRGAAQHGQEAALTRGRLPHGQRTVNPVRGASAVVPGGASPDSSRQERRMRIVEQKASAGDRPIFELAESLSRPLYAHLAHSAGGEPRESPVWFHWDGQAVWIIGGTSFPTNLKREPRCALGIVDWDPATGKS